MRSILPRMPTATTSSPFCRPSSMVLCSLAFFICGRIMMKYMITNMRMMGRRPISVSPLPADAPDCAKAVPIMGKGVGREKTQILSSFGGFPRPHGGEFLPPGDQLAALDRAPQCAHQLQVVMQVVDRVQARAEDLVGAVEMVQVAPGEVAAGVALSVGVQGLRILAMAGVLDLDVAPAGEEPAVPRVAGGQHAIEHVDAAAHGLHQVLGRAHAHEVA